MALSLLLVCSVDTAGSLRNAYLPHSCFSIVGTCLSTSLSGAKEQFRKHGSPDVLLCDIDFFADWEDLYTYTRRHAPCTRFLVCSPSGNFALAAQAIELGVDDCLLKPLTPERIFHFYQKNLRFSSEAERTSNAFWQQTHWIMLEHFFSDLLTRRIPSNPGHLTEILTSLNHAELVQGTFTLILLSFERHRTQTPYAQYLLSNYADAILLGAEQPGLRVQLDFHLTCFLLIDTPLKKADLVQMGCGILTEGHRRTGSCANLCIGAPCCLSDLPSAYESLQQLAQAMVREGQFNVCRGLSVDPDPVSIDSNHFSSWAMMLGSGLRKETETQILNEVAIMESRGNLTDVGRVRFIEKISDLCVKLLRERQISESSIFSNPDLKTLFPNAGDSRLQMEQYITTLLSVVYDAMFPSVNDGSLPERAKQYIDNHIFEKLTRESVANQVHVNKDYLARVFKSTEGISITDYITKKRMEIAKQMLATTSLSITTIAEDLGFSNPSHFCSMFKREFGMPPALYRRESKSE